MVLKVSFNLGESDLQHFRLIMREARHAAAKWTPEEIVARAAALLRKVDSSGVPEFVSERLAKLELMINMLTDAEWRLPAQDSTRVLNALAYFCEPDDLIPDDIPGLGFLDDAIMIELVVRELSHEIDAYRDFCDFRSNRSGAGRTDTSAATRDEWLAERRKSLQSRMRRRRQRNGKKTGSDSPLGIV